MKISLAALRILRTYILPVDYRLNCSTGLYVWRPRNPA